MERYTMDYKKEQMAKERNATIMIVAMILLFFVLLGCVIHFAALENRLNENVKHFWQTYTGKHCSITGGKFASGSTGLFNSQPDKDSITYVCDDGITYETDGKPPKAFLEKFKDQIEQL